MSSLLEKITKVATITLATIFVVKEIVQTLTKNNEQKQNIENDTDIIDI